MTIGEAEFDSIFRRYSDGDKSDINEIPFQEVSYILWVIFVVLMPILLSNLLVSSTTE